MVASLLLEVVTLLLCGFSKVEAAGGLAILQARSAANTTFNKNLSVCVLYNKFQKLPSDVQKTNFHQLVDLSDTDGCTADDFIHLAHSLVDRVVAVMRGTCNFTQKARMVQDMKGAAILVVDYVNSNDLINPGGTVSEFNSFKITLATITFDDYIRVLNLSELVEVTIYAPVRPIWDSVMILVIVLPTVLVAAGATWSAYDEFHHIRRAAESHAHTGDDQSSSLTQNRQSHISVRRVTVWFCCMCAALLLLYFFHDYMVRFFIALFCVLGSFSLYKCLHPLWSRIVPGMYCISTDSLPCIRPKMELKDILLLISCLTVGIYWAIERHARYAWILQDLLGATLCIYCIHELRLPNLKVIMSLLLLLLVYDVFFVFVTPFFTSDRKSIMESIATGGRGQSKETLPLLFLLPNLSDSQWRVCLGRSYTMLGFGDVVVPGVLVAHNAVFDIRTGNHMVYFICSSIGYFVGMVVCIICLFYMDLAQPALLYLVPSTLFTTVIVALIRKEFRSLFFGLHRLQPTADNHIEPATVDDCQERDVNGNVLAEEEKNLIH